MIRENGVTKLDSQVAGALSSAQATYESDVATASESLKALASSSALQDALSRQEYNRLPALIVPYAATGRMLVAVQKPDGSLAAGSLPSGPASVLAADLVGSGGDSVGRVTVALPLDADRAGRLSTPDAEVGFLVDDALYWGAGPLDQRLPPIAERKGSDVTIGGDAFRAAALSLPDTTPPAQLVALAARAQVDGQASDVRRRLIAVGIFVLILLLILGELLVRAITGQLDAFARRAQEVGAGRLEGELPVHGNDEFAQVARSFNQMARELERRIAELEDERRRVARTIVRFGHALESTHDVAALLRIVVESAMEAVRARGARLMLVDERTGSLVEHLRVGEAEELGPRLPSAVERDPGAEGIALQTLRPSLQDEPLPLVAVPLQSSRAVVGLLTVVGPEREEFSAEDGETLLALARQAAVAIDNAHMHRVIAKQALTDGLTGLANHRAFQDQLRNEVERSQRFGLPLSLILLDLDEFKQVNDVHGHLAGDTVLRGVASVLRGAIREIDLAARYGGEEFAIVLPGTSAEGAVRLAERLRVAVAARPMGGGDGPPVTCTASFGIAEMPGDAQTQVDLIAAADGALYAAKQGGRNRVVAVARNRTPRG